MPQKAVHALREALAKRGREALMPRIARAFGRVAKREMAKTGYTLSVAHGTDEAHARSAAKKALESMRAAQGHIEVRTDDTLIGGWRLEGADKLVDASYKKYLLDIYSATTK